MAITDRAAVVGNSPGEDDATEGFETVSFIGQVQVKVVGPVQSGDYLVASGESDGTAKAVSVEEITIDQIEVLIGQAWESSADASLKRINTAVDLDRTEVLSHIIRRQQRQIDELREVVATILSKDGT